MTHPPRDLTPLPDLLHGAARAGPVRTRHPFFLATLFQPELAAEPRPHPIIRAFAAAATGHARQAQGSPPVPAARP